MYKVTQIRAALVQQVVQGVIEKVGIRAAAAQIKSGREGFRILSERFQRFITEKGVCQNVRHKRFSLSSKKQKRGFL